MRGTYQDKDKFSRPDMILLDINMPKVDGFGVLKALKSDRQYASIPIIIFSASKTQIDVAEGYANGANSLSRTGGLRGFCEARGLL